MLRNNKIKLYIIAFLFFVITIITIYIYKPNLLFTKFNKSKTNVNNTEINKLGSINGKISKIENDNISLSNNDKEINIKINNDTTYYKNVLDPKNTLTTSINKNDIKIGMVVDVNFTNESSENNLIAKNIIIAVNEVVTGKIVSIDTNSIVIFDELGKKNYSGKLYDKTMYYRQSNDQKKSYQPDLIGFNDLKTSDLVVLFTDVLSEDNFKVEKVLLVPLINAE